MDLGSIFFISGILILAILFISQPFIKRSSTQTTGGMQKISSLIAEQERIINALLELDFDFNLGKVPAEDYPTQRSDLLAQGAQIMQQLDTLRSESASGDMTTNADTAGNSRQAVSSHARLRKERGGKRPLTTPDDDLEILLAARRRERGEKAGGFCPQCGNPIQQSDRFCPRCGEALSLVDNNKK